jgi:hypothetical protein
MKIPSKVQSQHPEDNNKTKLNNPQQQRQQQQLKTLDENYTML